MVVANLWVSRVVLRWMTGSLNLATPTEKEELGVNQRPTTDPATSNQSTKRAKTTSASERAFSRRGRDKDDDGQLREAVFLEAMGRAHLS